jgi:predicted Fe-S protein YdhL (DUF1289 family)
MDEKYCFGCARYKKTINMQTVKRGKAYRAICTECLAKKNAGWYGKEKTNVTQTDGQDKADS